MSTKIPIFHHLSKQSPSIHHTRTLKEPPFIHPIRTPKEPPFIHPVRNLKEPPPIHLFHNPNNLCSSISFTIRITSSYPSCSHSQQPLFIYSIHDSENLRLSISFTIKITSTHLSHPHSTNRKEQRSVSHPNPERKVIIIIPRGLLFPSVSHPNHMDHIPHCISPPKMLN